MALVKCKNCQGMISDKAKKCVHCGYKLDSINKIELKYNKNNILNKTNINILFTLIFIFMLYFLKVVNIKFHYYSVIGFLEWLMDEVAIAEYLFYILQLLILSYLLLAIVLYEFKKIKLTKFLYFIILACELLLLFCFGAISRIFVSDAYYFLIIFTIFWIISVFHFTKVDKFKKPVNDISVNLSYLDELKKLKELYDTNVITKEDYDELKSKVIEKR